MSSRGFLISICAFSSAMAHGADLFASKIEPLLKQRCFECHSHEKKIKGGLALDSKSGWEKGGESGPAIVPGKPEVSLLIQAVSHVEKDLKMPPKKMLPLAEIEVLSEWVRQGAPDPRVAVKATNLAADDAWEVEFQKRLDWWSLKPMRPATSGSVDGFIRAAQKTAGLEMTPQASPEVLRRRLSFVLTGLPPSDRSDMSDPSDYVDALLASPHFGEHFARHWMDVVRYTDTYGYEWDNPAKGSHEYRDYLIRAFNDDIGFDQLLREHLAGDLLPKPRIHAKAQTNESLIGPMFYHLGEHRHGSSLMFNGIHQEMVNNKIDAFSKAFLATTVACARCHDHKLEAVSQRDYYALAAMFTTPRWTSRVVDVPGKNDPAIAKLKELRSTIQRELATKWRSWSESLNPAMLREWVMKNRVPMEDAKPDEVAHPFVPLLGDTVWFDTKNHRATASTPDTKLSIESNGSILASGDAPPTDTYTVRFTTESGIASQLRLQALVHDSLPKRGPGRTSLGNFVLTHLHVDVQPFRADRTPGPPQQIKLAAARADYAQPNYPPEGVIDPSPHNGWAVGLAPQVKDHTAHFSFAEPVELPHGGEWTVTLHHDYGTQHILGCFRLTPGSDLATQHSGDDKIAHDKAIHDHWQKLATEWRTTRDQRRQTNKAFPSLADPRAAKLPAGWVTEGDGMKHGFVEDATPLIALEGDSVVSRLLPPGWHTHALSSKLPGTLRMPPQHDVSGKFVSLNLAGGEFGGYLVMDDHAFQNETVTFLASPRQGWRSFADAELKNGVQQVTVEFPTSSLNPNFPPRTGMAPGLPHSDFGHDKRSWLSITGIVSHEAGGAPQDEIDFFATLYEGAAPTSADEAWSRLTSWLSAAVRRWCDGTSQPGDREILDWMARQKPAAKQS